MKPIIKINKVFFLSDKFSAITLFPFIFIKKKYYDKNSEQENIKLIRHETIHFKQQLELLIIFFYLWYGVEFLIKKIKYGKKAYRNLSFEREAYTNENSEKYLKNRKFWDFIKYI